jgi:hypothetical protein
MEMSMDMISGTIPTPYPGMKNRSMEESLFREVQLFLPVKENLPYLPILLFGVQKQVKNY